MSAKSRWVSGVIVLIALVTAVPVLMAAVRGNQTSNVVEAVAVPAEDSGAVSAAAGESPMAVDPLMAVEQAPARATNIEHRDIEALTALLAELESEQAGEQQRLEQAQKAEEAARKVELEAAKAELMRVRRMFEVGMATERQVQEAQATVARIEAGGDLKRIQAMEIEAAKRRYEDARRRVEMGVLPPSELAQAELALRRLETEEGSQNRRRAELAAAESELAARRQLVERGLLAQDELRRAERRVDEMRSLALERNLALEQEGRRQSVEAERRLRELVDQVERQRVDQDHARRLLQEAERKLVEQRMATPADEARLRGLRAEYDDLNARYQRLLRDRAVPSERARTEIAERMEQDTTNRAIVGEDVVIVTIQGESELPTVYRIDGNGTIRVPLLGSFKVLGQTPSQVRDAIGKRLSETRLGSASSVRVTLRRRVVRR